MRQNEHRQQSESSRREREREREGEAKGSEEALIENVFPLLSGSTGQGVAALSRATDHCREFISYVNEIAFAVMLALKSPFSPRYGYRPCAASKTQIHTDRCARKPMKNSHRSGDRKFSLVVSQPSFREGIAGIS